LIISLRRNRIRSDKIHQHMLMDQSKSDRVDGNFTGDSIKKRCFLLRIGAGKREKKKQNDPFIKPHNQIYSPQLIKVYSLYIFLHSIRFFSGLLIRIQHIPDRRKIDIQISLPNSTLSSFWRSRTTNSAIFLRSLCYDAGQHSVLSAKNSVPTAVIKKKTEPRSPVSMLV